MTESSASAGDALEDIAYLSRSANRVRILEALATRAYPRRDLEEATGTSRTTLGRILTEFEERGWAERTADGTYAATPRGKHVAAEFRPLATAFETIRSLGEAVACLPVEELSIGLHHFSDATVRRPSPNEPLEPGRHLAELLEDASTMYTLTFVAPPAPVGQAMADGVRSGRLTVEHVLAGGLVEHLRDRPEGPPQWREYLEAGANVYRYEGHIPCNLFVVDERVLVFSDRPEATEAIESDDETVRAWAVDLVEGYGDDAERVEAESFA